MLSRGCLQLLWLFSGRQPLPRWREPQILRDRRPPSFSMRRLQTLARLCADLGGIPDLGHSGIITSFSQSLLGQRFFLPSAGTCHKFVVACLLMFRTWGFHVPKTCSVIPLLSSVFVSLCDQLLWRLLFRSFESLDRFHV